MEALFSLQDIRFSQGAFTLDLSLSLKAEEKLAIIGPTGSGKSTLLNLIAGFIHPQQWQIWIGGRDMTFTHPGERPVAFLFQEHNLFPHLTLYQNVALGINSHLKLSSEERHQVFSILERMNLQNLQDSYPGHVSGGERQRTALARSLLRKATILLLDEPFTAQGPGVRKEMLALLEDVQKEFQLTILMTTHQPEDALAFTERAIFLNQGAILADGPTDSLLGPSAHPVIQHYLG